MNSTENGSPADEHIDNIGDDHLASSVNTPMRPGAFDLSEDEKIEKIAGLFAQVMDTLGLDLKDDSLQGTPKRVAKMYVKEIFGGLNPENMPRVSVYDNQYKYGEMLVEKNISFHSACEHHFMPFYGMAHVAYFAGGKVIGLSKINRLVDYYARRPQVQERLSRQVHQEICRVMDTQDVAVVIEAKHMCVSARGVRDHSSSTVTAEFSGKFNDPQVREEFLTYVGRPLLGEQL